MSRIGKKPIALPANVKVTLSGKEVTVEGKAKLSMTLPPLVSVEVQDNTVLVHRDDEERSSSAMQGLARSLINNMVIGVTEGFKKELQIVGVGYKAAVSGSKVQLALGYSHPIEYSVPAGIKVTVTDGVKILIEGADKQVVGAVAADIRSYRKPEPYKGKGIRYADERIIIKEGKSVG